jgi:hypothetical protein
MSHQEEDPLYFEKRAQRMVGRWAGVQGQVRTNEERNATSEVVTNREEVDDSLDHEADYIFGNTYCNFL